MKRKFQILTHGNVDLAEAIQKKLFELGYQWRDSAKKITCLNEFVYRVGYETKDKMIFGSKSDVIEDDLVTLDELFAMTPETKETIKIGDQTYDKAEFEKATENLKPIK